MLSTFEVLPLQFLAWALQPLRPGPAEGRVWRIGRIRISTRTMPRPRRSMSVWSGDDASPPASASAAAIRLCETKRPAVMLLSLLSERQKVRAPRLKLCPCLKAAAHSFSGLASSFAEHREQFNCVIRLSSHDVENRELNRRVGRQLFVNGSVSRK